MSKRVQHFLNFSRLAFPEDDHDPYPHSHRHADDDDDLHSHQHHHHHPHLQDDDAAFKPIQHQIR